MQQLKILNLNSLEQRITKESSTKEALRQITPFTIALSEKDTRLIVKTYRGTI